MFSQALTRKMMYYIKKKNIQSRFLIFSDKWKRSICEMADQNQVYIIKHMSHSLKIIIFLIWFFPRRSSSKELAPFWGTLSVFKAISSSSLIIFFLISSVLQPNLLLRARHVQKAAYTRLLVPAESYTILGTSV